MTRSALYAVIAVAAFAGPVAAQEAIATSSGGSPPAAEVASETASQVRRWIRDAPPVDEESPDAFGDVQRKVHGEVGVAVGTGGYRSGYLVSHIPIGKTGQATIAISQSKGRGYGYGYGYGHPYDSYGHGPLW